MYGISHKKRWFRQHYNFFYFSSVHPLLAKIYILEQKKTISSSMVTLCHRYRKFKISRHINGGECARLSLGGIRKVFFILMFYIGLAINLLNPYQKQQLAFYLPGKPQIYGQKKISIKAEITPHSSRYY